MQEGLNLYFNDHVVMKIRFYSKAQVLPHEQLSTNVVIRVIKRKQ